MLARTCTISTHNCRPHSHPSHKGEDESEDEIEVTGMIPGHVPLAGQKRPMRDLPWTGEWDFLVMGRDLVW